MNYDPLAPPSSEYIQQGLHLAIEHWRPRNDFIKKMRDAIDGKNLIEAPSSTNYKIRTMHTFYLASVLNEKLARFNLQPDIQVVPNAGEPFDVGRSESSELERALRSAFYEMERNGDGDVWTRVAADAIALDIGVERIERAPSAFWPELPHMQDLDAIEKYKMEHGLPIRSVYVPPEQFFPVYEGSMMVETYEVYYRTVRSVLDTPTFREGISKLPFTQDMTNTQKLQTIIPIVMYNDRNICAYYAMAPQTADRGWKVNFDAEGVQGGTPILLHSYPHYLGKTQYNVVAGRFGGWKGDHNRIEGVGLGLLELSQVADEVASQVLTNVRARYWPTLVHKIDYDRRGQTVGTNPRPLNVPEGQNISIFKDEEIVPIFQTEHDEAVVWVMDLLKEQIGRLGGSEALFGMRQPGVETGYHQSLQLSQAEHLDAKIEQHLTQGAINRATLLLDHVIAMNSHGNNVGKVYTSYIERGETGKVRRFYAIDPKKLSPMPVFDARVRKPRPIDVAASMRAALDAGDERGGKGPLFSDETIRAEILSRDEPDTEERRILVESQKRALIQSGALTAQILKRVNMLLVTEGTNEQPGGPIDPTLERILTSRSGEGRGGGQPAGQSQPEQAVGNELAGNAAAGAVGLM